MHASKDSMWWRMWKILQNFLGTKQSLSFPLFQYVQHRNEDEWKLKTYMSANSVLFGSPVFLISKGHFIWHIIITIHSISIFIPIYKEKKEEKFQSALQNLLNFSLPSKIFCPMCPCRGRCPSRKGTADENLWRK